MGKIRFILCDSIKGLCKSKKMNIIFACTLYGSMILIFYCLGSIRFLQTDLEELRYKGMESSVEAGFMAPVLTGGEKERIFAECGAKDGAVAAKEKLYFPKLNHASHFVLAVDEQMQRYVSIAVSEGKRLSDTKEQYECIVGADCAKTNGLNVGDKVAIMNESFEIIGITAQGKFKDYLIIPLWSFEKLNQSEKVQQTLYLTGKAVEKETVQSILEKQIGLELLYSENATDTYAAGKTTIDKWIRIRELVAIAGALFATFNILAVCFGKIQEARKTYLIKKVLGLTQKGVFLSFFIENIIVVLVADIIAIVTFRPFAKVLGIGDVVLMDSMTAIGTIGVSVILATIYAVVLCRYLNRCKTVECLQEGE